MKTLPPARIAPAIVLIGALFAAHSTPAATISPMFTVVDLGTGFQLQTDATGYAHSVTGADGSAYAFDKSPTTSIYEQVIPPFPELHNGGFDLYLLQNGSLKSGYVQDEISGTGLTHDAPLSIPITDTWHDEVSSPVLDMNSHGAIVGTSSLGAYSYPGMPTIAAFSDPTGISHVPDGDSNVVDNLNNYIVPITGVTLTSAVKIDDLGRIIAVGSNGDDYLLNPVALGPPSPTPEPTTFAILAIGLVGFGARRRFLRRR